MMDYAEYQERARAWLFMFFTGMDDAQCEVISKAMLDVYSDDPAYGDSLTFEQVYDRCGVTYARS